MSSSGSSHRRHRTGEDAVVGQFVIGGEIGKGSFAQVFIGKHKVSGAAVAVKSVELARLNKKLKENLYGEIKILKTLRHPHIVALHDCVETATHINLVMEYCELGDLSMFIKKREKLITNPATHDMARKYPSAPNSGLNEVVTRHFLKQLASALKFLREGNFVHRDVKPQNLLLLPSPNYREAHKTTRPILTASNDSLIPVAGLPSLPMLKLADFGFARVLPSTTLAETLCGSPLYMAPEILRYERYDAKADLWSVGTVLYEMVCGRPPFRASNHVELLRKIEAAEDLIKFTRDCVVSSEMKGLIRALLKRNPVERISFENFFNHDVVTGPIPGLVEDDVPPPERPPLERVPERRSSTRKQPSTSSSSRPSDVAPTIGTNTAGSAGQTGQAVQTTQTGPTGQGTSSRRSSFRRYNPDVAATPSGATGAADATKEATLTGGAAAAAGTSTGVTASSPRERAGTKLGHSPRHHDVGEGLGIRRPQAKPSTSAPTRPMYDERKRLSNASMKHQEHRNAEEKAAQDIAFERDYVLVEKKHVEVNAFADEMAANRRVATPQQQQQGQQGGETSMSPRSGSHGGHGGHAMVRRATQPTGTGTGGVSGSPSSRAMQMAQGAVTRNERHGSLSASPNSATSFIAKAIHDASFRLLGVKAPAGLIAKGTSPPQLYNPFPAYPTPSSAPTATGGLLTDGRHIGGGEPGSVGSGGSGASGGSGGSNAATGTVTVTDRDTQVALAIEECATRSDVVYGFAEVKYKQLVPLAPSAEYDLGGLPAADKAATGEDEDELTVDAVVVLSEEALVLYVKALSLLAKSMDIASVWWKNKTNRQTLGGGGGGGGGDAVRDSAMGQRINAAVQWVRSRFNEVLEKANFARERLIEAQKRLPEDHPSHPSSHVLDNGGSSSNATDGVYLSPGVSAEKLMYDRAVEMSRAAAIGEISNDDLAGCELSYATAICMLEAVLETDEREEKNKGKEDKGENDDGDINTEDQKTVEFMISMIRARREAVRRKARLISSHSRAAAAQQQLGRRRSGDVTPRSVPSHAS